MTPRKNILASSLYREGLSRRYQERRMVVFMSLPVSTYSGSHGRREGHQNLFLEQEEPQAGVLGGGRWMDPKWDQNEEGWGFYSLQIQPWV